jgi:hypothetical protein
VSPALSDSPTKDEGPGARQTCANIGNEPKGPGNAGLPHGKRGLDPLEFSPPSPQFSRKAPPMYVVVPPLYLVTLFGVPAMVRLPSKVGESNEFGAHGKRFTTKRLRRDVWFLRCEGETRGRFGTAQEIQSDIGHVLETGALPREKHSFA